MWPINTIKKLVYSLKSVHSTQAETETLSHCILTRGLKPEINKQKKKYKQELQ